MGTWNYYIVTEEKPVRLEDLERALHAVNPDFFIDADLIILRDGYQGGELECAQITIEEVADPHQMLDRAFLEEQVEGKQNRERLVAVLDSARCLVVVQLL